MTTRCAVLLGPAVAAACAVPLLQRLIPRRVAVTVARRAGARVGADRLHASCPACCDDAGIPLFLVQGVILVGSAVALALGQRRDLPGRRPEPLLGRGRAACRAASAFAYPLARPFRTGLLLGMYALVIFTLTFLAVFAHIFAQQAPALTDATRAGYDLLVDSNPANPVDPEDLAPGQPGVDASATARARVPRWTCRRGHRRRHAAVGHHRLRRRSCWPGARPSSSSAGRALPHGRGGVAGGAGRPEPGRRVRLLPPGAGRRARGRCSTSGTGSPSPTARPGRARSSRSPA